MQTRLVHLDVEDISEELLCQLSYAIKNQLVASKAPRGVFCSLLAGSLWHIIGPVNESHLSLCHKEPARRRGKGALDVTSWFFMA